MLFSLGKLANSSAGPRRGPASARTNNDLKPAPPRAWLPRLAALGAGQYLVLPAPYKCAGDHLFVGAASRAGEPAPGGGAPGEENLVHMMLDQEVGVVPVHPA